MMNDENMLSENNPALHSLLISRTIDNLSTEIDNETVILNISAGIYSTLDMVGTTIWNLLESPVTISEIINVVLMEYDVTKEQCITDLLDFLNSLSVNNLITISNG
jgi:hypothetical protein